MNKFNVMSSKVKIERNGQMFDEAILEIYPVENKSYFGFAILRPVSTLGKTEKTKSNGLLSDKSNKEDWAKLKNKFCYLVTPSKKQLSEINEMMTLSAKNQKKLKQNKPQRQEKKPKSNKSGQREQSPTCTTKSFLSNKQMKRLRSSMQKSNKNNKQQVVAVRDAMEKLHKSQAEMLRESKAMKWKKNKLLAVCLKNKRAQEILARKYKRMKAKKHRERSRPKERKFRALTKIEFYTDLAKQPIESEFASIDHAIDQFDIKTLPFTNSRENSPLKQSPKSTICSIITPNSAQMTLAEHISELGDGKDALSEKSCDDLQVKLDSFQFESLPFTVEPEKEPANLQVVSVRTNSTSFTPEIDFELENSEAFWQTTRFDRIVRNFKDQLDQTNPMNAIKFLEGRNCKISIYLQHELSTVNEQSPSNSETDSTRLTSPTVQSEESVESVVQTSENKNGKISKSNKKNVHFGPKKKKKGFFRKLFGRKKNDDGKVIEIKVSNHSVSDKKAQQKLLKSSESLISLCNSPQIFDLDQTSPSLAKQQEVNKSSTNKTLIPDKSNLLEQKKKSKGLFGCSPFRNQFSRFLQFF